MKILITGGTGTVGSTFIKHFPEHEYVSISRGEEAVAELRRSSPNTYCPLGSIENLDFLDSVISNHRPDVVIHTAAIKHINLAELNPIHTCRVNILGSLNVLTASIRNNVKVVIGISTDKACESGSVYGDTKSLMEKCFLEANGRDTRVAVARFANVAGSKGSVIPFWLKKKEKGEPLPITDKRMTRLMFSATEAVELVYDVMMEALAAGGGFIGMREMYAVELLKLAEIISTNIREVGLRPGEKLTESLFSGEEADYIEKIGNFLKLDPAKKQTEPEFSFGYDSYHASKMSEDQIKELLKES